MTDTPNLGLPLLAAAQSQKHVTHNEALALVDGLAQIAVVSRRAATPPVTRDEGACWIVPPGAAGEFAGQDGRLALVSGEGLLFLTPKAGWFAYVLDEARFVSHDGAGWVDPPGLLNDDTLELTSLAVGTASDAGNPLSVKANDVLFAARTGGEGGSGDMRCKLEKEAAGGTASQLYQTGFSGRAETGLIGDDHFRIKVSADGSNWRDAVEIDPATGVVTLPSGGIRTGGACLPAGDNSFSCGAGGARWSAVWSATGVIQTSDAGRKTDVRPSDLGLAWLRLLNPVSFRWVEGEGGRHYGLIAQQVRAALDRVGVVEFGGHVPDDNDAQGLRYDQFMAPLIRAVQELDARLAALEAEGAAR